MRYTYDETVDCGYIYVAAELERRGVRVARTIECKTSPCGVFGQLNVDVDADGRVLGIEVLGVSRTMPELRELAR